QPHAPSHPALLSPLFSLLLQTMAAVIALSVAVLALQQRLKSSHQIDAATTERMKQREECLNREVTRLLHEIERSAEETARLSASSWRWLVWTIVGALVLLALVCWLHRKRIFPSECCSEQEGSSSKEEKEKEKEEEGLKGLHSGGRSWATFTPSPMQGLPNKCKELKELVGDLLGVCQVVCKSSSMPQMYPGPGMDDTCEAWSIQESSIDYQLLVFLRPPPGHSFHLEPDTTGQLPARPSNIRVVLECVCWKKQLLRGTLCFLHHHEDKLPKDQR
ncbi:IPIL1 protein, partial [Rynchops niger]|nr:IPIL1 protein [Rynchops niger]